VIFFTKIIILAERTQLAFFRNKAWLRNVSSKRKIFRLRWNLSRATCAIFVFNFTHPLAYLFLLTSFGFLLKRLLFGKNLFLNKPKNIACFQRKKYSRFVRFHLPAANNGFA